MTMHSLVRRLRPALCAATIALATPAFAADDSLYRQLGAQPGLESLIEDLMQRLLADPRMNPFFKEADQAHIQAELVLQFCELSGGPCRREGPDMQRVHEGMDIDRAAFNALVEVLQQSMDARNIPFSAQNRLLALLAPMHREIINVP